MLGAAGVGKSRLVGELLGEVGGQALVARGRCLPYGDGITFWPLLEVTKEALGLADDESSDEVHARLVAILDDEAGADAIAQRVAETTGLAEVSTGSEEGLGFAAVRSLFEALARMRPLVVVFDDIHWAEPTFLDLVEHVAETARDAPILLICIARPELLTLRTDWGGGKQNATSVLLEPLSEPECAQLLGHLVGPQQLDASTAARIAQVAEGNPLFVEEIVSMLIDDGLLVHRSGRWLVTGDISTVRVPPTIQALLAARLDRLEAVDRRVLERAAVTGKVFYEGAVRELAPETLRSLVPDALASLVRQGPDPPGSERAGRAHVSVPPPADPGRGLRLHSQGIARRAARALRRLARGCL